ncbi:MAG: ROK family protein [Armatimonadota bacterium]
METSFLGLDVGNSRLSSAMVSRDGRVLALARISTPAEPEDAVEALEELAERVAEEAGAVPEAAGIGFGGPVDLAEGVVRTSFLSRGWEGLKLGAVLAERLGVRTFLINDADAGGLGEALFGAAAGAESALYVNVGTGIGGAVVLGGKVRTGTTSSAGEIGHFTVLPDGPRCECGKLGCTQAVSSGTAMARRARELLAAGEESVLRTEAGGELTGRDVGEAAEGGDALALRIVGEAARWLGVAVGNAALLIDPAVVVIGGGVAEMGETFLGPLRRSYARTVLPPMAGTPVVPAALGYEAGVIGAAAAAMTQQGTASEPITDA